jgi:hypothetical protein
LFVKRRAQKNRKKVEAGGQPRCDSSGLLRNIGADVPGLGQEGAARATCFPGEARHRHEWQILKIVVRDLSQELL